jgi:2-methylcitrate dehydratase PrpD
MPDVNLQYQLALLLTDGKVSFASCHDQRRMDDPPIKALRERIRVAARADAAEGGQAHVAVTLADGRTVEHQVVHVRGTPGNPMTAEEVVAKAQGLIEPVVGAATTNELIARLLGLEQLVDVRALRPLLQF